MSDSARARAEMPTGTDQIVNSRTLDSDFPYLATVLRPGMSVLDVGCAGGALTRGVAEKVGQSGRVVGLDANARLLAEARQMHGDTPNLEFVQGDAYALPYQNEFDVVFAARMLQWLERPADALQQLIQAARPGGLVVVLDYNHRKLEQIPVPPASFLHFHDRYLAWREQAGMDNEMADHLADLFVSAGLRAVQVTNQHETTRRDDADFARRISLKVDVVASRGHQLVQEGWLGEAQRALAEQESRAWAQAEAQEQTLYLLAVSGVKAD